MEPSSSMYFFASWENSCTKLFFQMTISWFWAQIQSDQRLISFVFTYVGIFLEKNSVAQLSPMHYCMSFAHYLLKFFSKMVGIPNKWFPKAKLLFRWRRLGTPLVIKWNQIKDQLSEHQEYVDDKKSTILTQSLWDLKWG